MGTDATSLLLQAMTEPAARGFLQGKAVEALIDGRTEQALDFVQRLLDYEGLSDSYPPKPQPQLQTLMDRAPRADVLL